MNTISKVDEKNVALYKELNELKKAEFELTQRQAMPLAKSAFFPDSLRGDIASAVIIMELAERMHVSVMEVAQSIYIIHGRPSFSTTFLVARLNQSGLIKGALKTVVAKDGQSAYCEAVDAETGETLKGMTITMDMARAEEWLTKNRSKWQTMPELMLRKRAQSFFIKEFYPQVMFGIQTVEEVQDIVETEVVTSTHTQNTDINAALTASIQREEKPKTRRKAKPKPKPQSEEPIESEVEEKDVAEAEVETEDPKQQENTTPCSTEMEETATSQPKAAAPKNNVSTEIVRHYPLFIQHGLKRTDCNSFAGWAGLTAENIAEVAADLGALDGLIEQFKAEMGYA
ncbi:hypothetical protein [Hydrogenimonas sp.]